MGYRIVVMSNDLFEQMFTEGYTLPTRDNMRLRVTKGLPVGAKLESVSMDALYMTGQIALKYSHPSWEDPPFGVAIPHAQIEFVMEETSEFRPWMLDNLSVEQKVQLREELDRVAVTDDGPCIVKG